MAEQGSPQARINGEIMGQLLFSSRLDEPGAQLDRLLDALSGLINLGASPTGMRCTFLRLPSSWRGGVVVEEDIGEELAAVRIAEPEMHGVLYLGDEIPRWALDRIDVALKNEDVLAASIFLFVSQLEYAFVGGDVDLVLARRSIDDVEASLIDRVRVRRELPEYLQST